MDGIEQLWFNMKWAETKNTNPDERPDEKDGIEQLWFNLKSAETKNMNPDERPDEMEKLWFHLKNASATTEVSKN